MRQLMAVAVATGVALIAQAQPSAAREWHPWCAQYYDTRNLIECTFNTFEQCQASISGIGGNCIQNWYPPPEPRRGRRWHPFYR